MSTGHMTCLRCRGVLHPSGQEPHRFVCSKCGQNFLAVFQIIPVPPRESLLQEGFDAEPGEGARSSHLLPPKTG